MDAIFIVCQPQAEGFESMRRSRSDFLSKLLIQRRALEVSSKAFDDGEMWEAERLATTVFNLVVDKGRIRSLLGGHLGILHQIKFISSCLPPWPPPGIEELAHLPRPIELIPASGFVELVCTPEGSYFAPVLAGSSKSLERFFWHEFDIWWKEPIFTTREGHEITRCDLVWIMRTKDGGSHIDSEITDPAYVALVEDAVPGMMLGSDPIGSIHYVVMRQIAWEVGVSLDEADRVLTLA